MVENIVERAIVPHNPAQAKVIEKEKYDLFAPIAKNGQAGMAKFDKDVFIVKDGEVYLHKNAIIKLLGESLVHSLVADWPGGGLNTFDLRLNSFTGDMLSKMNLKLDAHLGIDLSEPNVGPRDWLTIALTATNDNGIKYDAYQHVLLPITKIRDLRLVQQDETGESKLVLEYFDGVDQVTKTVEVEVPKIELADTLEYNDEDKAPSVKAVNEGLNEANARTDGLKIVFDYDSELYRFKARLVDKDGVDQSVTNEIDLPMESVVIGMVVSDDGQNLILTLNNGTEVTIPAEALVRGLTKQEDVENILKEIAGLKTKDIELTTTLDEKLDKSKIVQTLGDSKDVVMSQKAVNEGLASLSDNITGYVDKSVETSQNTLKRYVSESISDIKLIVGQAHTIKRMSAASVPIDIPDEALPILALSKISEFHNGAQVPRIHGAFTVENSGDTTPSVSHSYGTYHVQAEGGYTSFDVSIPFEEIAVEAHEDIFVSIEILLESELVPSDLILSVSFEGTGARTISIDMDGENRVNRAFAGNRYTVMTFSRKAGVLNTAKITIATEEDIDIKVRVGIGKTLYSSSNYYYPPFSFEESHIGVITQGVPIKEILYDGKNIDMCGYVYCKSDKTFYYNYIDYDKNEAVINLLRDGDNVVFLPEEVRTPIPYENDRGVAYREIPIGEGTSRKLYFGSFPIKSDNASLWERPIDCEIMYVTKR